MDLNLPDSSATEALGQALARSLPGAVRMDAVPTAGKRVSAPRQCSEPSGWKACDATAASYPQQPSTHNSLDATTAQAPPCAKQRSTHNTLDSLVPTIA